MAKITVEVSPFFLGGLFTEKNVLPPVVITKGLPRDALFESSHQVRRVAGDIMINFIFESESTLEAKTIAVEWAALSEYPPTKSANDSGDAAVEPPGDIPDG